MRKNVFSGSWLAALVALAVPLAAIAQTTTTMPSTKNASGNYQPATGTVQIDSTGADATDTTNHAVKVNCVYGCSGSGGGGGAITAAAGSYAVGSIVDGADLTLGTKADSAWTGTGSASAVSALKGIYNAIVAPLPAGTNAIGAITNTAFGATQSGVWTVQPGNTANSTPWIVTLSGTNSTVPVTGTFWQSTQPISAASLPLPTGAATSANQPTAAAIASTTSGQTGLLAQGAVTTAAPAYTTAQTNPLSLTTAGGLRGDVASYAGTALTGTVTAYGTAPTGNTFGVNASVTNTVAVGNVASIASNTPAYALANGSTLKAAAVTLGTAVSQVDQNATAFAGSGSVLGTIVASAQAGGATIASEINVTALTLGTATAVIFCLDESTGGTNTTDIWCSDPITATGITRVPAVPVAGRRLWRAFSVGGTSTTVTTTITSLELPAGYPVSRQFRDYFAATNPFATRYNSAALTASNFVLGTVSTATTPFYVENTKQLVAFMTLAGGPTVTTQPVVGLQLSMDGTNWFSVTGATMTAAGNGTYMTASQSIGGAKFARLIVTTAAAYSAGSYTISNIGVNAVN